jgi:hypothetical protein
LKFTPGKKIKTFQKLLKEEIPGNFTFKVVLRMKKVKKELKKLLKMGFIIGS